MTAIYRPTLSPANVNSQSYHMTLLREAALVAGTVMKAADKIREMKRPKYCSKKTTLPKYDNTSTTTIQLISGNAQSKNNWNHRATPWSVRKREVWGIGTVPLTFCSVLPFT